MITTGTKSKDNGLICCYNMFPRNFKNISEMTDYLPKLKRLGMNVVWINPIQLAGQVTIENPDKVCVQVQSLKGSLYAMADEHMIDPRFSMVARDEEGDMLLTEEQYQFVQHLSPIDNEQLKELRGNLKFINNKIINCNKHLTSLDKLIKKKEYKNEDTTLTVESYIQMQKNINDWQERIEEASLAYQFAYRVHLECIREIDKADIRAFTNHAKSLGITPIFDLVLNHLAIDSEYVANNLEYFNLEDKTFPDATAFAYSKLVDTKYSKQLTEDEREYIVDLIPKIIEDFWRPFLEKYILDYGFCGARVDCVRKLPQQLREPLYEMIRELIQISENNIDPVILEETLFSDLSPSEFVALVQGAGATHNTGSVYYLDRLWHGGLSANYSDEDYHKRTIVENGVINFTGNHDHFSCALKVCRDFALERLCANEPLYRNYLAELNAKRNSAIARGKKLLDSVAELILSKYIHYYHKQIISELMDTEGHNDTIMRFGMAYRDKIFTNAFAGSGGYYMLSGDEFASLHQPSVFIRGNGEQVISNQCMKIFQSNEAFLAHDAIHEIADEALRRRKNAEAYINLSLENQEIMRSGFVDNFINEVNAKLPTATMRLKKKIKSKASAADIEISEELFEYVSDLIGVNNQWGAPDSLSHFVSEEYFAQLNEIIGKLPRSNIGFWSELFKVTSEELVVAVRMNGVGYEPEVDVIIFNLNPHHAVEIGFHDLHKFAIWFQSRGYPNPPWDDLNWSKYQMAYDCIMGSSLNSRRPANLYFGGKIKLAADLMEHHVIVEGETYGFNLISPPESISRDALLTLAPQQIVSEDDDYIPNDPLLWMANMGQPDSNDPNMNENDSEIKSSQGGIVRLFT